MIEDRVTFNINEHSQSRFSRIITRILEYMNRCPNSDVNHHEEENQIFEDDENLTLRDILKTKQFWLLYIMNSLSLTFCVFYLGSSKSYAMNIIQDDKFLSLIASIALFCGILRFLWSISFEYLSYKTTYSILLLC